MLGPTWRTLPPFGAAAGLVGWPGVAVPIWPFWRLNFAPPWAELPAGQLQSGSALSRLSVTHGTSANMSRAGRRRRACDGDRLSGVGYESSHAVDDELAVDLP